MNILRIAAIPVALMCSSYGQYLIDNIRPPENGYIPIGHAAIASGRPIDVPIGARPLDSFTIAVMSWGANVLQGAIYAWNGTATTGPAIYESAPVTLACTGYCLATFDTGGLSLAPGRYILLVALRATAGAFYWGVIPSTTDHYYCVYSAAANDWRNGSWVRGSQWQVEGFPDYNYDLAIRVSGLLPGSPIGAPASSTMSQAIGLLALFAIGSGTLATLPRWWRRSSTRN